MQKEMKHDAKTHDKAAMKSTAKETQKDAKEMHKDAKAATDGAKVISKGHSPE